MRSNLDAGRRVGLAVALLGLVVLCSACEEYFVPPEAPEEIEEIHDVNAYLLRNFDSEEDNVLEPALAQLIELLEEFDLDTEYQDRCFTPELLTEEDITGIEYPRRDLGDLLSVALVMSSEFPPVDQTRGIVLEDQRPMEPASPDHYIREFLDPTDPGCFPGRGCPRLDVMNDIIKDYLIMTLPYDMPKTYRWVEVGETGSGEWAILARAWIEQEWETDGGAIQLSQSYNIDLFYPRGDGGARYMTLWFEMFIDGLTDEVILDTTIMGMNEMFVHTEDHIGTL